MNTQGRMMRQVFGLIAAAGLLLCAGRASAHAFLLSATPAVGGVVHAAPGEVSLGFSESVEPTFSTIAVQDASGASVTAGRAHSAGSGTELAVALKALRPGTYTVVWHALSTDTHKTEGRFSFTVAP